MKLLALLLQSPVIAIVVSSLAAFGSVFLVDRIIPLEGTYVVAILGAAWCAATVVRARAKARLATVPSKI